MKNVIYAQSGGATAVINVTARAVIEEAREHPAQIDRIYVADGGITGVLTEKIFDVTDASAEEVKSIENQPGAFFGTCRYKMKDPKQETTEYERIFEVFKEHNIGYFLYNGGNDSQDTTNRIAQWCGENGMDVQCIGIPKTVDNDLAGTDSCPGFGSIAKYIALAVLEITADLVSICSSSTKVFILETMGRDAGWIAASSGLAKQNTQDAPQIILLPEVPFVPDDFLRKVHSSVEKLGYCVVVASEGIRDKNNEYLAASKLMIDSFGHQQLGGVAPILAETIKKELGYKYHWAVPDYMQRAAKHIVSEVDYNQAAAVGKAAVKNAIAGKKGVMVGVKRLADDPYKWDIECVPISQVANKVKRLPESYVKDDSLTPEGRAYMQPLILGEKYPVYEGGLLQKSNLVKKRLSAKLPSFKI